MSNTNVRDTDSLNAILGEIRLLRGELFVEVGKVRKDLTEDIRLIQQTITNIKEEQTKILVQTTRTNGRVTSLEEKHKTCPGVDALKSLKESEKQVLDLEKERYLNGNRFYQAGKILLTNAIVAGAIYGILIYFGIK